jgi:hypothetical protein
MDTFCTALRVTMNEKYSMYTSTCLKMKVKVGYSVHYGGGGGGRTAERPTVTNGRKKRVLCRITSTPLARRILGKERFFHQSVLQDLIFRHVYETTFSSL